MAQGSPAGIDGGNGETALCANHSPDPVHQAVAARLEGGPQRELGSHRHIYDQPPEAPDELLGGPVNSWPDGRIRCPSHLSQLTESV
jgi:hypothetical protein